MVMSYPDNSTSCNIDQQSKSLEDSGIFLGQQALLIIMRYRFLVSSFLRGCLICSSLVRLPVGMFSLLLMLENEVSSH